MIALQQQLISMVCNVGDIWSEGDVSLLGIVQYHIDKQWELLEKLVSAEPFSKVSHTGEAIDDKTKGAMAEVGFDKDNVYEEVFHTCSDNGANMVKGWSGFDQGFCAAHTSELAIDTFLNSETVKPTVTKVKGLTACNPSALHRPCIHCLCQVKQLISITRDTQLCRYSILCKSHLASLKGSHKRQAMHAAGILPRT